MDYLLIFHLYLIDNINNYFKNKVEKFKDEGHFKIMLEIISNFFNITLVLYIIVATCYVISISIVFIIGCGIGIAILYCVYSYKKKKPE